MVDAEQEVHGANTLAWISSDPIDLVLTRTARVKTDSGAWETTTTDLPAQTFRMDRSSNQSIDVVTTVEGQSVPLAFRIVGSPTADVEEGDTFTIGDKQYSVTYVYRTTFTRVAAEVEYHG